MALREAWKSGIEAADYERHMAAIGQAQANAGLLDEFARGLDEGARLLVAGAGPGQFLEFMQASAFERLRPVFSDISGSFLRRLRLRLEGAVCVADDLERSALKGPFDAVSVTLVLEHIDWRRGVATLCRWGAGEVLIVVQRNPAEMATAVSPARQLPGSMEQFRQLHPTLIEPAALCAAMAEGGYSLSGERPRAVADGKTMLGLWFRRT